MSERSGTAIVIGGDGVMAGVAPVVRDIAERTNLGVLNTWAAKGLFPWNHPAHLGTMGLQAGDIALAGLSTFADVVLCGVSEDELPRGSLDAAGVSWRDVEPADLATLDLPVQAEPTPRPALYTDLSAVCQPMYAVDSLPLNAARTASDLAAALPDNGVICGDAGRAGFWLGRTVPTRALGSVRLPVRATPGFAATQALMARRTGQFSVAVVDSIDPVTRSVMDRAADLLIEIWSDEMAPLTTADRTERLLDAHRRGGVHILEVGVDFTGIDALVAVAGAPLWGA